ncbi:NAD-dependent epimerase/dehydratase [Penicillium occitanis (nom. inval.)]|nr:NAD-dependent epimerase/dehydratase [Penicillium occitanis (nom. inval.)]PCG98274.1 hypothetical protein PENOC_063860 [Penicillium occitanis (nom. inval.)]
MMASHAVRIAHARARLRQTKQFQAQQSQQKRKTAAVENAHTHQSDTLDSIATPLSRLSTELMLSRGAFETPVKAPYEFLFHHYVHSVMPLLSTHCKWLSEQIGYTERMNKEWNLNMSITAEQSSKFNDSTLALVIILAQDEVVLGDFEMAQNHMRGASRMAELNGGQQTLGLDGFLELVFNKWVDEKIILIFIMSEPTNIPAGSTVLVTGVNGFVASHIAKQLLLRGFKVRGTVRDPERTSWLVKDAFKAYVDNGDFELVTIKDFTAAGVYDDAIKGVSAIAHVASVVTFDSDPNTVIPQTVQAATRILEAALNEPSVKTFVYTSSIVASTFPAPGNDTRVTRDTWNDVAIELAWSPPPHPPSQGSIVYAASKAAAEKAVWQFVEDKKPKFRVNSVNPAMIMGEPLDESHLQTVGAWIKKLWDGDVSQLASFSATYHIDVKDVAVLHVAAILDPKISNERLQAWAENCNWNDMLAILRRLYPQRHFIDDLPNQQRLSISTDLTLPLQLLKKWGNQTGWRTLEQTIKDNVQLLGENEK